MKKFQYIIRTKLTATPSPLKRFLLRSNLKKKNDNHNSQTVQIIYLALLVKNKITLSIFYHTIHLSSNCEVFLTSVESFHCTYLILMPDQVKQLLKKGTCQTKDCYFMMTNCVTSALPQGLRGVQCLKALGPKMQGARATTQENWGSRASSFHSKSRFHLARGNIFNQTPTTDFRLFGLRAPMQN